MNKDIFTAGSCGGQGCFTHEDKLSFGEENLDVLQAGDSGCDSCGCFTHKETLSFGKISKESYNAGCCSNGCGNSTNLNILVA